MSSSDAGPRLFRRWVLANTVGWLLGFVFIMVGAIGADVIGIEHAQFFIGIGMGAGVGYAQMRVATPAFGAPLWWGWATVLGVGAAFVLSDVVRAFWSGIPYLSMLWLSAACGGLLVGLLQRPLLRPHSVRANWWVLGCVAGWALAAATVLLYGTVSGGSPSAWLALISVAAIPLGGVVLGVVTGGMLLWTLRG